MKAIKSLYRPLALLALYCALLCIITWQGARADGYTANGYATNNYSTYGDATRTSTFFVTSRGGNAKMILAQQSMGTMRMVSSTNSIDVLTRSMYGRYRVTYTNGADAGEIDFSAQQCTLFFAQSGVYMVQVIPYAPDHMHDGQENYTPYLMNRFTGSYYQESEWVTAPAWYISRSDNCTYSAAGTYVTQPPSAGVKATVTVHYILADGTLLRSDSVILPQGVNTVYCDYAAGTYMPVGASSYQVTVYADGTVSQNPLVFCLQRTGNTLPTWTPAWVPTTRPTATPTPAVQYGTIVVYYRSLNGALLSYETLRLAPGTHTVYSNFNNSNYAQVGNTAYTVTVYSNGSVSAPSVTFYYTQSTPATPTLAPVKATIPVFYRTVDGALLSQETRTLSAGTQTVYTNFRSSDYVLSGSNYYNVTVYSDGTTSVSSLTFYYTKAATPTPRPASANITVFCRTRDGAVLSQETRKLTEGTHTVKNTYKKYAYILDGADRYTVTVYSDGTASTDSVTFYFVPRDPSDTDQEAIIGSDKIYPRPGPNKGKNEYWYSAQGQTITVHTKALSQKGDDTWWVCFSGELRCWGNTYEIDHMWIACTYLNPQSYDLDALPIDPEYQ